MVNKLKSRKLWAAIVGVVMGIAMVFGVDESIVGTVSGAVMSIASIITYIITEGKIDAAAVVETVGKTQNAIDAVKENPAEGAE